MVTVAAGIEAVARWGNGGGLGGTAATIDRPACAPLLNSAKFTYMATLHDLVEQGELVQYVASLEGTEQPGRYVYFSPTAKNWVEFTLMRSKASRGRLSPYEQMGNILHNFIIDRPIVYGSQYHPLEPIGHYVWELKTADVRLIGWFPRKKFFVVVCGRFKSELLKSKLYSPCVACVIHFRKSLDLDEPKMVIGAKTNDVL